MALDPGCQKPTVGSTLKLRDKKQGPSEFVISILNQHAGQFSAYQVDGCLTKDGIRCDFLVFPHADAAVLVELKGGDVEKGFAQLRASLLSLGAEIGARKKYAVLVPVRYPLPPYQTAKFQDIFRKLNCKLRIKNRRFDCDTKDF